MKKEALKKKLGISLAMCLIFLLSCSNAFARERGGHQISRNSHSRQRYHDSRFFRPGGFSFEIFFGIPHIGGVVRVLPSRHRIIIVRGVKYYYDNDIYYTDCPLGYVVVPPPLLDSRTVTRVEASHGEVIIINIPNAERGYTSVTLTRYNDGYLGPQGEYYPSHPTVNQLVALYGK
jgi:hypothetical protein